MSDLITLHQTRQKIGKKRQSAHSTKLDEFNNAISSVGISSPYIDLDMNRGGYRELEKINEYNQGSIGKTVIVSSEYVYRIALIHSLANTYKDKCKPVKLNPVKLNPDDISNKSDKNAYHKEFFRVAGLDLESNNWINLTRIINFGELYKNRRNFSFWTNSPLYDGDVLENTFKIGYPSDWIETFVIVLRCKTETLNFYNLVRIPTILDAFTEPIFLPVRDDCLTIKSGLAINIEPLPLSVGFNEYVIGPIEIENIEFLSVSLNDLSTRQIKFENNFSLWDKLEEFYNTL